MPISSSETSHAVSAQEIVAEDIALAPLARPVHVPEDVKVDTENVAEQAAVEASPTPERATSSIKKSGLACLLAQHLSR